MRHLLAILFCAFAFTVCAQPAFLPSDRGIDWSQCGVVGGVPAWSGTVLTGLDATGATDVSTAINSAMFSATPGTAVILPAGVFLLTSPLKSQNYVVLRGQGTNTIITGNIDHLFEFTGDFGFWATPANISSGYTKGSSNLVFSSVPSNMKVGMHAQMQQINDTSLVTSNGIDGSAGQWAFGQWVEIEAIVGSTVTVWPPLYYTYGSTFVPRLYYPVNNDDAFHNFMSHAGLENLILSNQNASAQANVTMNFAAQCWMKNVTSLQGGICHVWPYDTYRCEIRDSSFISVLAPITSSRCYGIQIGTPNPPNPSSKTTGMLMENNIFALNRGNIILGYGAAGCVIGYNFFLNTTNETPAILKMDVSIHSAHPYMNLIEGNVLTKINADDFHGSSSHNVIFRNYASIRDLAKVGNSSLTGIELDVNQWLYTVAENVEGYAGLSTEMTALSGGSLSQAIAPDTSWSYNNWAKALMFGYAGEGGGASGADSFVYTSVLMTNNFDYIGNANIANTNLGATIPASLYLAAKPAWWDTSPYPPIGPELTPKVSTIPAQNRYYGTLPIIPRARIRL